MLSIFLALFGKSGIRMGFLQLDAFSDVELEIVWLLEDIFNTPRNTDTGSREESHMHIS